MRTHVRRHAIGFVAGLTLSLAQATWTEPAAAGPYAGPPYFSGDVVAWATSVEAIQRGPVDIVDPNGPLASFGTSADALGARDTSVVSLGDGGSITLVFGELIGDGPGDDFAVFENGFLDSGSGEMFAELAFVDVSSDGTRFARFSSVSLHEPDPEQLPGFATLDPSDIDNLAGDQPAPFGTGFDLSELSGHPLVVSGQLDLYAISHVRLVDVIGDGSNQDALMQPIYDPYPTPFETGGFDLDAVGILNVPEPGRGAGLLVGLVGLAALARRRGRALALAVTTLAVLGASGPAHALFVVDFEDQALPPGGFDNGSDGSGGFSSSGVFFENTFTDFGGGFSGWTGFSSSRVVDTTTPGFGNQYAAYAPNDAPGAGAGGSDHYGVFFAGSERLVLPTPNVIDSISLNNTTYTALAMENGEFVARAFVPGDFLTLFVTGYDDLGAPTGSIPFDLGRYTGTAQSPGTLTIVEDWTLLDLTSLGTVTSLGFSFDGSDTGDFGINTPTYFAIDDVTVVPEPGTALLVGLGLVALSGGRTRSPRSSRRPRGA